MAQQVGDPLPDRVLVAQGFVGGIGNAEGEIDAGGQVGSSHHQYPGQPLAALAGCHVYHFPCTQQNDRYLREEGDYYVGRKGIRAGNISAGSARAEKVAAISNGLTKNGGHDVSIDVML